MVKYISTNIVALIVVSLLYLLLEGLIIGFSLGQRVYTGEMPPPQIILFGILAVFYPFLAALYLRGVRWGFIATMALAVLAIASQTPTMLLWLGRMSIWWAAAWTSLYILPTLIIFFSYRAYRES